MRLASLKASRADLFFCNLSLFVQESALTHGLLSMGSVAHGQPQSKNVKWEILEINQIFKLRAILSSVIKSSAIHSLPPGM